MLIGYAWVSSNDQDTAAQMAALKAAKYEHIYRSKGILVERASARFIWSEGLVRLR